MRTLHNMPGVARVHYDLEQIGTSNKGNGTGKPRAVHDVNTQQLVNNLFLKSDGPLASRDVIKRLRQHGRTDGAIYTAVRTLVSNSYASGSKEKGYTLTAKGRAHLAAGKFASNKE